MPATLNPMARLTSKLSAPDTSIQLVDMPFLPLLIGLVQDFHYVLDRGSSPPLPQARLQLNYAPRIGADDQLRARLGGGLGFIRHEAARQPRLREVVDSGAAAAAVAVPHLHQPQPGNAAQQLAWSFANALAVSQVAGVLIGHSGVHPAKATIQFDAGQE